MAFNTKHGELPSDFYAKKNKGKELMDTVQFGADLKLLISYEIECLKKLKKRGLVK